MAGRNCRPAAYSCQSVSLGWRCMLPSGGGTTTPDHVARHEHLPPGDRREDREAATWVGAQDVVVMRPGMRAILMTQ
jgi:hypothetical protein